MTYRVSKLYQDVRKRYIPERIVLALVFVLGCRSLIVDSMDMDADGWEIVSQCWLAGAILWCYFLIHRHYRQFSAAFQQTGPETSRRTLLELYSREIRFRRGTLIWTSVFAIAGWILIDFSRLAWTGDQARILVVTFVILIAGAPGLSSAERYCAQLRRERAELAGGEESSPQDSTSGAMQPSRD